jgi:hypothetical protein
MGPLIRYGDNRECIHYRFPDLDYCGITGEGPKCGGWYSECPIPERRKETEIRGLFVQLQMAAWQLRQLGISNEEIRSKIDEHNSHA